MRDLYFANLASPAYRQMQYLRSALMTLLEDPILMAFWKHQWPQRRGASDPSADALMIRRGRIVETGALTIARIEG